MRRLDVEREFRGPYPAAGQPPACPENPHCAPGPWSRLRAPPYQSAASIAIARRGTKQCFFGGLSN